jgi:streptogramin lyase
MNIRRMLLTLGAAIVVTAAYHVAPATLSAQGAGGIALRGVVASQQEGKMEGVLVTVRREAAPFSVTVVSDARGEYAFPQTHLAPGSYALHIRAAGYDLVDPGPIQVTGDGATTVDLKLQPAKDLAAQLTSLDWFLSMPGTPEQKRMLVKQVHSCLFCHTFERVVRSKHPAPEWPDVIKRMGTYNSDHTGLVRQQRNAAAAALSPAAQQTSTPRPQQWGSAPVSELAPYLASINLSSGEKWSYALKTLPRPKGTATRAIVTEYFPPRYPKSVIHDMDVDTKGNAWYGDTGWDFLGKLDPTTATFTEYPAPNYLPAPPQHQGVLDVQVDPDGNPWASIRGPKLAKFDAKTEQWTTYDLPDFEKLGRFGVLFLAPFHGRRDGTVWANGTGGKIYRLDITTHKAVLTDMPGLGSYMVERDSHDNAYFTDSTGSTIGRIDGKTGEVTTVPTPTPNAMPRRGRIDAEDRFWFTEFLADKIAMFDTQTRQFKEFDVPVPFETPYYAHPDRKGDVWVSSQGSDRLLRLNPKTGEVLQYLMPSYYDARKVIVDPSTDRVTIWLPNKNVGDLLRVEILD